MHNGWKNYQTWITFSWIANDIDACGYDDHRIIQEAKSSKSDHDFTHWLKDYAEMRFLNWFKPSGMAADLLNSAVAEIDWREISEYFRKDVLEGTECEKCGTKIEKIRHGLSSTLYWRSLADRGIYCGSGVHWPKVS